MMGKKQAIDIRFVFPEGREVKTKEQMIEVLRESYLRAMAKSRERLLENKIEK